MNFIIDLVTETGLFVDLILLFTGITIYALIKTDYDKRLEKLEGGKENE